MKVQFNMVTMKDGKINVEEKKDLSKMLTESMGNHLEFKKLQKQKALELDSHWYSSPDSDTFFTADLAMMSNIITDEVKLDKIMQRMGEGAIFGTFRRYKTQQPMLIKHYKTRRGAEQNTFWRNH